MSKPLAAHSPIGVTHSAKKTVKVRLPISTSLCNQHTQNDLHPREKTPEISLKCVSRYFHFLSRDLAIV
jgi:hypothetical protein